MEDVQTLYQFQDFQTNKSAKDSFASVNLLKESKLVFNNDQNDKILLTELGEDYKKVIEFPKLFHNIEVSVKDDSIYIFIVETAPGEACTCCRGSGRKSS